jgi:segregation and condensation protein B
MLTVQELCNLIECVLFLSPNPVSVEDLVVNFKVDETLVQEALRRLIERVADTGVEVIETAGGFEMVTRREYGEQLKQFFSGLERSHISRAALETLAIISYKQPITRADIETLRGVNSAGVLHSLLEKKLIRIQGKADIPGRPYLFATTPDFLRYVGMTSIDELPPLESLEKRL